MSTAFGFRRMKVARIAVLGIALAGAAALMLVWERRAPPSAGRRTTQRAHPGDPSPASTCPWARAQGRGLALAILAGRCASAGLISKTESLNRCTTCVCSPAPFSPASRSDARS